MKVTTPWTSSSLGQTMTLLYVLLRQLWRYQISSLLNAICMLLDLALLLSKFSTVNLKHWISMSLKQTQNLYLVRLRGKTSLSWPSATWTARWHLCLISMPLYRGKSLPKLRWYTNILRELKAKHRKLERTMLLTGFPEDKMACRNTRDEYRRLVNDTKTKYDADLIEESAGDKSLGDTKKLCNIINSLCKVDNSYDILPPRYSPQSLANDFGAFFHQENRTYSRRYR